MECCVIGLMLACVVILVSPSIKIGLGHKWGKFTNIKITTDILSEVSNIQSTVQCVSLCHKTEACVSVFYRRQHRRCQLHDVLFMSPQDGQEEAGTVYYSVSAGACPPSYIHNRLLNFCYQLHLDKIPYIEGLADCRSRGEHLIIINTPAKQNHFAKQVTASKDSKIFSYFIEGSDVASEGQWLYHDGRPVTYFPWAPGYPENSSVNRDYLAASRAFEFRWQDRAPHETKYYACEKDI